MNPVISTIIVNYNAGHILRDCVDSLLSSSLPIEVIVVDNCSHDGSLDYLADLSQVVIIKNDNNLGFAMACNIGARVAKGPQLLFLNPDCFFKSDALVNLLAALHSDEKVGMVGALIVNLDGTEQAGGRRAVPTPWRSFVRAFGLTRLSPYFPRLFYDFHLHKQPLPDHAIEVEAISGACMLVKRTAMDDVGEWDEGYFLHCEDLDWCWRFREKGWKILFVPSSQITHALGVCSKDKKMFVEWHKHRGMVRYYRKFYSNKYPVVLMGLVVSAVWLRFVLVAGWHSVKRMLRGLMNRS